MKTLYVVIDCDGFVSFSEEKDEAEVFTRITAAEKRATELAKLSPGQEIKIFELTSTVIVPVGKTTITREHQEDHYK